jgi:hypothetical protein
MSLASPIAKRHSFRRERNCVVYLLRKWLIAARRPAVASGTAFAVAGPFRGLVGLAPPSARHQFWRACRASGGALERPFGATSDFLAWSGYLMTDRGRRPNEDTHKKAIPANLNCRFDKIQHKRKSKFLC